MDTIPAPKSSGTALGSSSSSQDVTLEGGVRNRLRRAATASPTGGGQHGYKPEYEVHVAGEPQAKADMLTQPVPSSTSINSQPSNSTMAATLRQQPSRSYTTSDHVLAPLSTEPAGTILSTRRPVKLSQISADTQVQEIITSVASSPAKQSPDPATLLHPSSAAAVSVRPARRNTTGSALPFVGSSKPARSNKPSLTGTAPQVYDSDLDPTSSGRRSKSAGSVSSASWRRLNGHRSMPQGRRATSAQDPLGPRASRSGNPLWAISSAKGTSTISSCITC